MPVLSDDIQRLLEALRQPAPSGAAPDADPRRASLTVLAQSREVRAVPSILHLLPPDNPLSSAVADTIAALVHGIDPAQLAWIDAQARNYTYAYGHDAWWQLRAEDVGRLAPSTYPSVIGVVASHPSGFVRQAAVKALGRVTDGQEIPFLTIRANDWVPSVAAIATGLLVTRLELDNRAAVVAALPFLVRMLGRRRQDHRRVSDAVGRVLLSDGGRQVLDRVRAFETSVRRYVYKLVVTALTKADSEGISAALADADAVVRRVAIQRLAVTEDAESSIGALVRLLSDDSVPSVRREAMSVLARRDPDRLRHLLPQVLLDRSAAVRALARHFVEALHAPLIPRDVYINALNDPSARRLKAAIDGLGELGSRADLDLVTRFADTTVPGIRRSVIRAAGRLNPGEGVRLAIAALADPSPSVRAAAVSVLRANAARVDFAAINDFIMAIPASGIRERLLPVLRDAPKWDAAVYLLQALADGEPAVRTRASQLIGSWLSRFNDSHAQPTPIHLQRMREALDARASELPEATVRELRFIVKAQ
jgi:HEAT repeat protein